MKTRCKDKNGNCIYEGDVLHVEEYPGRYVGGSLDFEGIVKIEDGKAMVIGDEESFMISSFPVEGREILDEIGRYRWFRSLHCGDEPPKELWKEELYRKRFEK